MKNRSFKKDIKVGSIIRLYKDDFYEVTELLEKEFECRLLGVNNTDIEIFQRFYYNIDAELYNKINLERNMK